MDRRHADRVVPAARRASWEEALDQAWTPEQARTPNGAVWPTLATAVWALRRGWPFDAAMRAAIDIGADTDTVAAVTGGLLGAVQGIQAIPSRWSTLLTGELPGHPPVARDLGELQRLAQRRALESPPRSGAVEGRAWPCVALGTGRPAWLSGGSRRGWVTGSRVLGMQPMPSESRRGARSRHG
jgi:ADP-ribosylglycohydrolase